MSDSSELPLLAYEVYSPDDMPLIPSPLQRDWMEATPERFAYRCLPLAIANQVGWVILNPKSFTACWDGGVDRDATQLVFDELPPDDRISSLFGSGVITFNLPYLFRTPPDTNLLVKGPANQPKDGVAPLEGLVETDWTCATFTMNWKLTRPRHLVRFERGEPICVIVPLPRYYLERFEPIRIPIGDEGDVKNGYVRWSADRDQFHRLVAEGDEGAIRKGWQKDYFQGRDPGTGKFPRHQTKLTLKPFARQARNEE